MNNTLADPFVFLVDTLAGLYILAVMLRFLLQTVRADFYNPIIQVLVKLTNPPLLPLRRFIPGLFGIDMAAVVLMLLLQMATFLVTMSLSGYGVSFTGLVVSSSYKLTMLLLWVYFFSIIIQAIVSWIAPFSNHPAVMLLHNLNEPILRPIRRWIPPISGIDLSPMVVLIGIGFVQRLLAAIF
jgi:YggT family protein